VALGPGKELTGTALKRFARQNAAAFKVPRKVSSESFRRIPSSGRVMRGHSRPYIPRSTQMPTHKQTR
jgi:hypothetical protein